ncbi:MAG: hypothetical protein EBZ77_03635 [Chitinophagia bacterium]|nr:hypothetical protein [Chitinophagia bacterium]
MIQKKQKKRFSSKKMTGVIAQALDDRAGKWVDLPFAADELGEIMSCVVCTEPYYGDDASRLPHETCVHGHTCCVDCYARLNRSSIGTVSCPICRTSTSTSRLRVLGETDGILGMLVLRNRLRWACAARCGFSGRLAVVRAHTSKCARALVPCALCDAHVARGALETHLATEHARAVVRVRAGRARELFGPSAPSAPTGPQAIQAPMVLMLPLGVSVVVRPEPTGVAVSVVSAGHVEHEPTLVELELALFRSSAAAECCQCFDVLALARTGRTEHAVFSAPPNLVCATFRVPLHTVPAFGLVRVGGVVAVHVVGDALGESMLAPVRHGATPYAMASNVMVGIVEARVNERCWVREPGTGVCKVGTVVRQTDGTSIVRTNGSIVETPRVLCGAIARGA